MNTQKTIILSLYGRKCKVTFNDSLKDYSNDPVIVKKREEAEAFLKKCPPPEWFLKGEKRPKNFK